MLNVSIIGGSGYTGLELLRILSNHPHVKISIVTSRQYAGKKISEVFPSIPDETLSFSDLDLDSLIKASNLVFLCVPHGTSMELVPRLHAEGIKIIDLSADFRIKSVETFEKWYHKHTAPQLLDAFVYGLSEIFSKEIKNTSLIANPGCYPTSALIPLIPLLKEGFISPNNIIIDSKSGVTGAGRTLNNMYLYCEANEALMAYKIAQHRHTPEIEEVLSLTTQQKITLNFTPHLVPLNRGILTTIYCDLIRNDLHPNDYLRSFYKDSHFIRIIDDLPNVSYVRGTNYCLITTRIDKRNNKLIIISCIDNLMKGAAGQAVQNMNIMCGFDETCGLKSLPLYP